MPAKKVFIGTVLRRLRINRLLSQEELAFECSLERTYISALELNENEPGLGTFLSLAAALDIKPSEFMKAIEEQREKEQEKE